MLVRAWQTADCAACIDSCYVDVFKYGSRLSAKHGPERFISPLPVEVLSQSS